MSDRRYMLFWPIDAQILVLVEYKSMWRNGFRCIKEKVAKVNGGQDDRLKGRPYRGL